jgi:Protein of unknown function (DUF3574)
MYFFPRWSGGTGIIYGGEFMRTPIVVLLSIYLTCNVLTPNGASQTAPVTAMRQPCWPSGRAYTRTTLYLGLTSRGQGISESQWQAFLTREVTPRFPDGLTVWEADGQWRQADGTIGRERSKVLLLVHEDTAAVRTSVGALITQYKKQFQQESVLWETAPVCAVF